MKTNRKLLKRVQEMEDRYNAVSRAVTKYIERKILTYKNRTVVFG